MNIYLSELDQHRFGNVTAKASELASTDDVGAALAFCAENDVALLIARVDTQKLDAVHALESAGGVLCDTLVYYEMQTRKAQAHLDDAEFTVRRIQDNDRSAVLQIAREAFSDYYGHYHSDPRLDRKSCDETYVSWCESTIDNVGDVHDVIVIEDGSGPCGFLTIRKHEDGKLELVLSGIKKAYSGRGVYRRLIQAGVRYAVESNIKRIFTSTQISNLAVQWVWIAQGFIPVKSVYTFHAWLEKGRQAY